MRITISTTPQEVAEKTKNVMNLDAIPNMLLIIVVLPAPFGPINPKISPGFTQKDISFNTFTLS